MRNKRQDTSSDVLLNGDVGRDTGHDIGLREKEADKGSAEKYLSESAVHRHLLSDERCRVSYRDSDFSVLFRARSRAQLEVLESVCIALYKPNLCVQKLVSFSLLQDLSLSK